MHTSPVGGLALVAPNGISYRGRKANVGACVWMALESISQAGGVISLDDLRSCVYGHPVRRNTVSALISRANRKLLDIGAPWMLSLEGDYITII